MNDYEQIRKLKVNTERYVGKGYTLCINFETGDVDWADDQLFYQKPKKIKTLSKVELSQLLKNFKTVELLDWKGKYYDLKSINGEIWTVTIEFDEDIRKITGTTIHPASWNIFCNVLSAVSTKSLL
ncbi:MAG: hypothetical protein RR310_01300 [Eubacterium sp.]